MDSDHQQTKGSPMRRILSALLPLAMGVAALFAAAPAATAASVHPASANPNCPTYGPGPCVGTVSVTVTDNSNGTITIHIVASGFAPGENVNITVTAPPESLGDFTASSSGTYSGSLVLPAGLGAGQHQLHLLGTRSGTVASAPFTLNRASGPEHPCTASASSTHTSGVVLAAAYLSATCISNQAPGATPGLPSAAAPAAVGTATPQAGSQLPFTGFNAATFAAIGALAIGGGGALVLAARRRRRPSWK